MPINACGDTEATDKSGVMMRNHDDIGGNEVSEGSDRGDYEHRFCFCVHTGLTYHLNNCCLI